MALQNPFDIHNGLTCILYVLSTIFTDFHLAFPSLSLEVDAFWEGYLEAHAVQYHADPESRWNEWSRFQPMFSSTYE